MTLVVDASCVAAGLIEVGERGEWAEAQLEGTLAAPHLMPVEATDVLRRAVLAREISADAGSLAHAELVSLHVELFDYAQLADRVWELRHNVTAYDAWYVALAEHLAIPLATADLRLSRAQGPRCEFLTPPA